MKQETMPEGQSMGLEEQLRSLSPIIKAAMEKKAVINLTIYAGNIGQKIDQATHVFMEPDDECWKLLRKETMEGRKETADEEEGEEPLTDADMAAACEQTLAEGLWWADASWGTAYQIFLQKGYNGGIDQFVRDVKNWPFKNGFKKKCNKYSVGNPARKGKITWSFDKWRDYGVSERQIKLGERLLVILKDKGKNVNMGI